MGYYNFSSINLLIPHALVNDHPDGWPRLSAFLNSDDNLVIFRRFGLLHCRELVMLQAELNELEKYRAALDRQDASSLEKNHRLRTTKNEGWDNEQENLSAKIRSKLLDYGKCSLSG